MSCARAKRLHRRSFAVSAGGRLFLQNEINGIPEIIGAAHELELEIVFTPSPFTDVR